MKHSTFTNHFLGITLLTLAGALTCLQVSAQTNPCAIPGYPGCTNADFNRAMREQQYQNDYQEQLQLQRRNNELLRQQNDILRQQQYQNQFDNTNSYQRMQGQRCLSMPLGTPGC